ALPGQGQVLRFRLPMVPHVHVLPELSVLKEDTQSVVPDAQSLRVEVADESEQPDHELLVLLFGQAEETPVQQATRLAQELKLLLPEIRLLRRTIAENDEIAAAPIARDPQHATTAVLTRRDLLRQNEEHRLHRFLFAEDGLESLLRGLRKQRALRGIDALRNEQRTPASLEAWRKDARPRTESEQIERALKPLLKAAKRPLECHLKETLVQGDRIKLSRRENGHEESGGTDHGAGRRRSR